MKSIMARNEGSTRLDDDRMRGPITPPKEASDKDRQRIRQVNRNVLIRRAYPDLRDEHDRQEAWEILAERHNVSPSTVRLIVYGQR